MAQLTPGAVANLANGVAGDPPTLQVVGIKRLQNAQAQQDRFRMLVSDGEYSHSCMLATQLANLVHSGELKEGSIFTLNDYICNQVQNKKVVIVLNVTVIQADAEKVGNPQLYDKVHGAGAGGAAPAENVGAGGGGAPAPYAPPAYGGPPPQQQQQYGLPPPQQQQQYGGGGGGYVAPPAGAPYSSGGGAPAPGPYGGPPPNQGPNQYGGPPAGGGGYGAPPPTGPYGAPPQQQQRPPGNPYAGGPQYRGNGPVAHNVAPSHIMPINALNNYQNRWTIKARVTQKSDIRRYSNARGEGRFFSFDLLDAQGGEIRAVAWNDQCDRFEHAVEQGKVYLVSKASLKPKRGNFNQLRHQYEIHLENQSVLELCPDEEDIPMLFFNFVKIAAVEDTPPNASVDLVGVVESAMDWMTITKRDGTETQKRSITIRDDSNRSIELTLWGKYVNEPGDQIFNMVQAGGHPVLAVKSARVGDFNGRTLSTVGSSVVVVDPLDVPEALALRQWYDQGGQGAVVEALSRQGGGGRNDRRVTISQIKDEGLGTGEKPDWVQVVGAVTYLRTENMYYPACTNKIEGGRQCNKKLVDNQNGSWHCERCNGDFEPEFRYILQMTLSDHTGEVWVSAFQEQGPEVMGNKTAMEVKDMRDNLGDQDFSSYMQDLTFRHYVLKLKVFTEMYQDEQKVKTNVVAVAPPNYTVESKKLLDLIAQMEKGVNPYQAPAAPQGGYQQQQQQGQGWGNQYGGAPQQQHQQQWGGVQQQPQQQQQQWGAPQGQNQYGGPPAVGGGGYGGGGGGYGGGGGAPQYGGPGNPPPQAFY